MKNMQLINESFVRIEIISLIAKNRQIVDYQGFDTLYPVDNDQFELDEPHFISGVGLVKISPDGTDIAVNDLVAFCGFTSYEIFDEILIAPRSFIKIPVNSNSLAYSLLGYVTRLMALINKVGSHLGEKVLIIADKKEKILYSRIFEQYGFEVIKDDYFNKYLNSLNQDNMSKIDLYVIASDNLENLYKITKGINREVSVVFLEYLKGIHLGLMPSNLMIVRTLGKGYFDYKYMMGEIEYTNAYINDNVQYNMSLAVQFILENIDTIMSIIELSKVENCVLQNGYYLEFDKDDKFLVQYNFEKFRFQEFYKKKNKQINYEIIEKNSLVEFQKFITSKMNPAIIEFTFNAHKVSYQNAISYVEKVMNHKDLKVEISAKNDIVSIFKYYTEDGSLVIINLVYNVDLDNHLIEAHVDGSTLVMDQSETVQIL